MTSIFNSHLKVRRFLYFRYGLLDYPLICNSWSLRCVVLEIAGSWHPLPSVLCWLRLSSVHMLTRALLGLWIFHRLLGGGGGV